MKLPNHPSVTGVDHTCDPTYIKREEKLPTNYTDLISIIKGEEKQLTGSNGSHSMSSWGTHVNEGRNIQYSFDHLGYEVHHTFPKTHDSGNKNKEGKGTVEEGNEITNCLNTSADNNQNMQEISSIIRRAPLNPMIFCENGTTS